MDVKRAGNLKMNSLIDQALKSGATRASIIEVSKIVFSEELRKMCEQNACGKYGTNWVCPPAVGPLEYLKAKICNFDKGLVFQTVRTLEDSFDFEGMMKAKTDHENVLFGILKTMDSYREIYPLSAGACSICEKCAYTRGEKCVFPDKAFPSVEACGIDVNALVTSCGIPYINGVNTVSYVGLILFK